MNEAACMVGIDVSKRKLDIALLIDGKRKSKVVDNSASGHNALSRWMIER